MGWWQGISTVCTVAGLGTVVCVAAVCRAVGHMAGMLSAVDSWHGDDYMIVIGSCDCDPTQQAVMADWA